MDARVVRDWYSGVRTFGGKTIAPHVFAFVRSVLAGVESQQGSQYSAPPICDALLAEIQARVDRGEIFLSNPHFPSSSFPQPAQPTSPQPGPSTQPGGPSRTRQQSPQPGPSRRRQLSPQPGPSRKRQSPGGDKGPGGKRRREGPVPSSSPQSSGCDMELCSPSVSPVVNVNLVAPAGRRYMLRTAPRRTDVYQEPEQPNWGVNGTESNAITGFILSPPRDQSVMMDCTHCYCPLKRAMYNTAARPALCALCGSAYNPS